MKLFFAILALLFAPCAAHAASPAIAATNTSFVAVDNATQTVSLPAGIVAGQLLIIGLGCDGGLTGDATATGWTQIRRMPKTDANHNTSIAMYRWSDGGEGGTVAVTISAAEKCGHFSMRITGAENPSTQAPQASTGVENGSLAADPDTVTPTGGAKDYLFIAMGSQDGNSLATVAPTDFTGLIAVSSATPDNATDGAVFAASRQVNAASSDPGIFTMNRQDAWTAFTIAVHPVGTARRRAKPTVLQ
jgi:hypothetical protein